MYDTQTVFSKEIFKHGTPVKVFGMDEEGYGLDFFGLIKSNQGDTLEVIRANKDIFTFNIREVKGSPAFEADPDYPEWGIDIQVLTAPSPKEEESKKSNTENEKEMLVRLARELARRGAKRQVIADALGISRSTVCDMVNGKRSYADKKEEE